MMKYVRLIQELRSFVFVPKRLHKSCKVPLLNTLLSIIYCLVDAQHLSFPSSLLCPVSHTFLMKLTPEGGPSPYHSLSILVVSAGHYFFFLFF